MADLDTLVDAVKRAATAAGYVCDPQRAQIQFVVEREVKDPGPFGHPQCSLQVSLSSVGDLVDGKEDEFAAALMESISKNLPK